MVEIVLVRPLPHQAEALTVLLAPVLAAMHDQVLALDHVPALHVQAHALIAVATIDLALALDHQDSTTQAVATIVDLLLRIEATEVLLGAIIRATVAHNLALTTDRVAALAESRVLIIIVEALLEVREVAAAAPAVVLAARTNN